MQSTLGYTVSATMSCKQQGALIPSVWLDGVNIVLRMNPDTSQTVFLYKRSPHSCTSPGAQWGEQEWGTRPKRSDVRVRLIDQTQSVSTSETSSSCGQTCPGASGSQDTKKITNYSLQLRARCSWAFLHGCVWLTFCFPPLLFFPPFAWATLARKLDTSLKLSLVFHFFPLFLPPKPNFWSLYFLLALGLLKKRPQFEKTRKTSAYAQVRHADVCYVEQVCWSLEFFVAQRVTPPPGRRTVGERGRLPVCLRV